MINNLPQLLLARYADRPDFRTGVVDDQIQLAEAVRRAAGGVACITEHVPQTGRAAIVASSSTEYLIAWMACLLAGRPVALINPTYPPELLTQMLANLEPSLVFTDLADASFAGEATVLPLQTARTWNEGDPRDCPGVHADPLDIASFMHTSGTTGVPKFCAQTHSYFLRLGDKIAEAMQLRRSDRMLVPLPLFHINPLGYGIVGALTVGADTLALRKFSASGFWPTVRDLGFTAACLHAPPVEILKRATTWEDAVGHGLRTIFFADRDFMTKFQVSHAVSCYGSTEAAGVSHLHQWDLGDDIPDGASRHGGPPRSDIEDRLDEDGQIHVRERVPGTMFAGYFAHGQLNPARDADGWFASGDLGRRDKDAGMVFVERAAESIRVKGEFVPIPYVEDRLSQVPGLRDLALWKTPGELVDDEVVLYVVADEVPGEAIRSASQDLPAFMRPTQVASIQAIPRDAAAGKIQRRLLHNQEVLSWTPLA